MNLKKAEIHLKKYIPLAKQAENIDSYEAYKELIEIIKNMTYPELHAILSETETVLAVLCRNEAKGEDVGLQVECKRVKNLLDFYLQKTDRKIDLEYIYEFLEKQAGK